MENDFSVTGMDEIVLHYEIGKDRQNKIDLFTKGCEYPIENINVTFVDTKSALNKEHNILDIFIDGIAPALPH